MKYTKFEKVQVRNLEWFGGNVDMYNQHLAWTKETNDDVDFQNERWEKLGIPPGSIKIEPGMNYTGNADGDFEIRTINNELWFCSDWCCVNFVKVE